MTPARHLAGLAGSSSAGGGGRDCAISLRRCSSASLRSTAPTSITHRRRLWREPLASDREWHLRTSKRRGSAVTYRRPSKGRRRYEQLGTEVRRPGDVHGVRRPYEGVDSPAVG